MAFSIPVYSRVNRCKSCMLTTHSEALLFVFSTCDDGTTALESEDESASVQNATQITVASLGPGEEVGKTQKPEDDSPGKVLQVEDTSGEENGGERITNVQQSNEVSPRIHDEKSEETGAETESRVVDVEKSEAEAEFSAQKLLGQESQIPSKSSSMTRTDSENSDSECLSQAQDLEEDIGDVAQSSNNIMQPQPKVRVTRTKQKEQQPQPEENGETESSVVKEFISCPVPKPRSTRTKQQQKEEHLTSLVTAEAEAADDEAFEAEAEAAAVSPVPVPKQRSTRTKQKKEVEIPDDADTESDSGVSSISDAPKPRVTRTKTVMKEQVANTTYERVTGKDDVVDMVPSKNVVKPRVTRTKTRAMGLTENKDTSADSCHSVLEVKADKQHGQLEELSKSHTTQQPNNSVIEVSQDHRAATEDDEHSDAGLQKPRTTRTKKRQITEQTTELPTRSTRTKRKKVEEQSERETSDDSQSQIPLSDAEDGKQPLHEKFNSTFVKTDLKITGKTVAAQDDPKASGVSHTSTVQSVKHGTSIASSRIVASPVPPKPVGRITRSKVRQLPPVQQSPTPMSPVNRNKLHFPKTPTHSNYKRICCTPRSDGEASPTKPRMMDKYVFLVHCFGVFFSQFRLLALFLRVQIISVLSLHPLCQSTS